MGVLLAAPQLVLIDSRDHEDHVPFPFKAATDVVPYTQIVCTRQQLLRGT